MQSPNAGLPLAQVLMTHAFHESRVVNGLLMELSLWMMIYTESSSMRHTSEVGAWSLHDLACGHQCRPTGSSHIRQRLIASTATLAAALMERKADMTGSSRCRAQGHGMG